ncbi:hypothetical protein MUP01_02495 [Candidatus Bathyarchaeota archaeon]|nr:hypothetical protein [Candidatus Bathyarchaeota archaeon]
MSKTLGFDLCGAKKRECADTGRSTIKSKRGEAQFDAREGAETILVRREKDWDFEHSRARIHQNLVKLCFSGAIHRRTLREAEFAGPKPEF